MSSKSILHFLSKWCVILMLSILCTIGFVNVHSVSAAEDSITLSVKDGEDITAILQEAVRTHQRVVIPKGKYYCSGIKLNNISKLEILADGATIIQNGTANPILYVSNGSTASDIAIIGGEWNANGIDMPAIRFYGTVSNITLENLIVINSANSGIRFKDSENVNINGVTVSENSGYGIIFEGVSGITVNNSNFTKSKCGLNFMNCSGNIEVNFAVCENNTDKGIFAVGCPSIMINDSDLNYNGEGLRISGSSGLISLRRNNVMNNAGMGIRIFDCTGDVAYSKNYAYYNGKTGVSMENCTGINSLYRVNAKKNKDCGFTIVNCINVKINRCASTNNTNYGYNLDGNKADSGYRYCVNMKDSSSSYNGRIGIRVVNSEQNNIQSTVSENNSDSGLYSYNCEAVTLNMYEAHNNNGNGASINNTSIVKVAASVFDTNIFNGLRINACGTIWVNGGEYFSNKETGILLSDVDKISVKSPVIHNNDGYGLNIDGISDSGLVKDSVCYDNGNIGLRYKDAMGKMNTQYAIVYNNLGSGIYCVNCANMVVNGCEVYSNKGFGINNTDSTLANVKYCNVYENTDIGIRFSGCYKIILTESVADKNVNAGIYSVDCNVVTINKVKVRNNKGFGINSNNGRAILTVDSVASGNTDTGFRFNECRRINIQNVIADGNLGSGIYGGAITGYINVIDSDVLNNGLYGLNYYDVSGKSTINNVTSISNKSSGYIINACTDTAINNSLSNKNGEHGMYILDSTAIINGADISESYWCGLSVSGLKANAIINGGRFINNGTRPDRFEDDDLLCAGIGIYEGSTAVITEVDSNYNHGCGITAAGDENGNYISTAIVYGCTTSNNGDHGVGARPYGKINICASESGRLNIIENNKFTGFIINDHCTSDYVKDCVITGSGKAGISISEYSSVAIIENNIISQNNEDGIHVSDNSSAVIKNCTSKGNNLSGIGVYLSSNVSVSDKCVIEDNEHYGICIDGSLADVISDTTIFGNLWAGVAVRNSGKIANLSNCVIDKSGTYGIYCGEKGSVTCKNVTVMNSTIDGIRITGNGSKFKLTNATVTGNNSCGIVVADKALLAGVNGAKVNGNTKHGVAIYSTGETGTVTDLVSTDNGGYQIYVQDGAVTELKSVK